MQSHKTLLLETSLHMLASCENFVQVELHPRLYQKELLEYCKRKGIQLQAYTSLGQGKVCCSALLPLDIHFVLSVTMNFEGACCKATMCMCSRHWHERFYLDIKNNQESTMYKNGFSKQTTAYCSLRNMQTWLFSSCLFEKIECTCNGNHHTCIWQFSL